MNCKDCNKLLAEPNPTCAECVGELQAQLDDSESLIKRMTQICTGELRFEDDYVDINAGGLGSIIFMQFLVDLFEKNGGENFLTWGIKGHGHDYSITIQNCDREITPAQALEQLQAENAALKSQFADYKSSKPTVEQVAWVFEKIYDGAKIGCSFRKLIYDYMGFDGEAYQQLYEAGGMAITNYIFEAKETEAQLATTEKALELACAGHDFCPADPECSGKDCGECRKEHYLNDAKAEIEAGDPK